MTINLHSLRAVALGLLTGLLAGQPVLADDTEIFVGRTLDAGQANVLFVIDTSGSMGSKVDWDVPFVPADSYAGDCDADRVYWTTGGSAPDCDTDRWVYDHAFVCQEGWNSLNVSGYYNDKMAQYSNSSNVSNRKWNSLNDNKHSRIVDCAADSGRHGDGSSETEIYAAQYANGPYDSEPNGSENIDWDDETTYSVYSGNYMNYVNNPAAREMNRLDVVKIVTRNTLSNVSGINIGLMRFDRYSRGGMVTRSMAPISTEFDPLTDALDDYVHGGGTPLAETMYEATRYFSGASVDYGRNSYGNNYSYEPSVSTSRVGDTYIGPIANQCQKNFVVLLTDGEPTNDTGADTKIANLSGFFDATGQTSCSGNCLDEVGAYLHNKDLNSTLDGDQTADVFTIGFHTNQQLLQDTATRGGGEYYTADNAEDLTDALTEILDTIIERDTTFTAPAIGVNTYNRLTHREEIYISMFRPTNNPHWDGNMKRYRLSNGGGTKEIYDATNRPAINPATDTFYEDAKSYWTIGEPDGYDTTAGGLSSRLRADRNVYTVTSGATSGVNLADSANRVHEDNLFLTEGLFGVPALERTGLIQWARGVEPDGTVMNILGDALHTRPLLMSWGGSEADPDLTLFYTTNDGYLHAVDPMATVNESLEIFSFIPAEMLSRMSLLKLNERNNPPKFYGLDGPISSLIWNDDGDQVVESGEKALIFFGMRRGGSNYYAIDVTDRASPKLAWTIHGGEGDFMELGQTWSEMTPATVKMGGTKRDVLFFGGGYATAQDVAGTSVPDSVGRAVYMVDALTGDRLWWTAGPVAGPTPNLPLSAMSNSIPSDVLVIDINSDGLDDRLYVGDMGGQMWRFDLNNETSTGAADFATGGVIADVGGTAADENRRIYYPPSVSSIADNYHGNFLAIAFGTGHRANPLGTSGLTVEDKFYMLRDPYVFSAPLDEDGNASYAAVSDADFLDVTTNLTPSTEDLNGHSGWSISLDHEEKVLAKSLTADGRIFFTSYLPDSPEGLSCSPTNALGSARAYEVQITTGGPPIIIDNPYPPEPPTDDDPECQGRCTPTQGPIPPEPILVFTEPDPDPPPPCPVGETCAPPCDGLADVALIIGTDVRDPSICTSPVRTYWFADGDE